MPADDKFLIRTRLEFDVQLTDAFPLFSIMTEPTDTPEPMPRMSEADAAIYALSCLLSEYGKPMPITGAALHAVKQNRKLKIEYDKILDIYTFSSL